MSAQNYILIMIALFSIILSVVQTEDYLQIHVTRQIDGDILSFKDKVDCLSLNARCLSRNGRPTSNLCDLCKCLPIYSTYVSTERQCININGITNLNCRTLQKQLPMLSETSITISEPIVARRCKIKNKDRNPEFHSSNVEFSEKNETAWSWQPIYDVRYRLKRSKNEYGFASWQATFHERMVTKMLSKYPGGIVKLQIRCRGLSLEGNVCIIFKIAGTIVRNSTIVRRPYSYRPFTTMPSNKGNTSCRPSGKNTDKAHVKNKTRANNQLIWIVVPTVTAIVVILIGLLTLLLRCKRSRKQTRKSNTKFSTRNVIEHNYDVPVKSTSNNGEHTNNQNIGEPFYETISKVSSAQISQELYPPSGILENVDDNRKLYQELNHSDRDKELSHYQPLLSSACPTKFNSQTNEDS